MYPVSCGRDRTLLLLLLCETESNGGEAIHLAGKKQLYLSGEAGVGRYGRFVCLSASVHLSVLPKLL